MEREKLFQEFPPVSTKDWKDKVIKDLKGADFDKKLVWRTGEGFDVQPFYTADDLGKRPNLAVCPGDFPFLRGKNVKGNKWLVRQDIHVGDIREANAKVLDIRMKGVDSIGFIFEKGFVPTVENIESLLQNIRLDLMELNFKTTRPLAVLSIIDQLAKKYNRDLEQVKGSLDFDPLGHSSLTGNFYTSQLDDFNLLVELVKASQLLPKFQVVTVDGTVFHNAGSGIVSQLAFSLAKGADYLTHLTEHGIDIDQAAPNLRFNFAVGSNYFMEIAKFRAARYLWANIVNAYGLNDADNAAMFIHCSNSEWNKTTYDPYVNMLRTTTETMSSLIGGVDSMTVLPFNKVYESPTEFSERIARNQQLLLKGESYFDKVNDPAAGSYYIEELTEQIIQESWKLFLEVDEMGGYQKAFEKGFIQEKIKTESQQKDADIANRKRTLLGTNQYPNITEHIEKIHQSTFNKTSDSDANTINLYRGSQEFEKLRFKTDQYALENKRPTVWMFTFGNLAMRNARAQFAANFFGCAGFNIINNPGFQSAEAGIASAKKARPDIVVICSSDDEYADNAINIYNSLKDDTIVVLAGYPKGLIDDLKENRFDNFIHVKTNVLAELTRYQQLLNIG